MKQVYERNVVLDPQCWGLPMEAVLTDCSIFRPVSEFKTKTRDPSKHAWSYLRGLLTMRTGQNYANIARQVIDPGDNGQNFQGSCPTLLGRLGLSFKLRCDQNLGEEC